MAQLVNNFEGGSNGAILTAGSGGNTGGLSGDYFDIAQKNSDAILQFSNAQVYEGSLACQLGIRTAGISGSVIEWTSAHRGQITDDYIRFYYYSDNITTGNIANNIVRWFAAGSSLGGILMGNNRLYVTDNTNTVQAANSTSLMVAAQWVRIEAHIHPSTIAGSGFLNVRLYLNPTSTIADWDFTATASTAYAQNYTDQINFGNPGAALANWPSSTGFMYFDGIVTGATTWVGVSTPTPTIQYQVPNADISTPGWTPTPSSPITLYDKIDETTPSDADYISATAS